MNLDARHHANQRGAALLILVAVLGLGAASLLIGVFGKNTQQAQRERKTLATLVQAREALLGFAAVNGRLPRPAASSLDGREQSAACRSEADCSGFLPWVTLGIDGADSWGKLLRYSVTPAMTVAPIAALSAVATKTVHSRDERGRLFLLAGYTVCGLSSQCLPFVVFSQGRNNVGVAANGMTQANMAQGNLDEAANQQASVRFISRMASDDTAQPGGTFDDMLVWSTLPALYQRMRAARNLP
ncbi:hypothetical protein [Janthinobacterium agaricidamnosum]|uniref:Uncharacterized protein n=1 Tax=Janthinobacterium agaricidamnosum NBRC 102515 = DSM 9628 TaxID=1349767 RepID=W0V641_9BURK|nr:hypothetical protein [Janthinobacterium agaricidamnosum]CDG82737.1 hypothetical protein GJA_2102 [Janthinobacterium agaricidamnosum NBRC 102515 = DSM 9628]